MSPQQLNMSTCTSQTCTQIHWKDDYINLIAEKVEGPLQFSCNRNVVPFMPNINILQTCPVCQYKWSFLC